MANGTLGAVIWDMDGVLVDTGEGHFVAWRETLARYAVPFDAETFRQTFGMNNDTVLRLLLGERFTPALRDEISETKETLYRENLGGQVTVLPGVEALLESIAAAGAPQAIGSSAPQVNIDLILAVSGLGRWFDVVVSAAEMPGKPDPTVFLTAAARLGVSPDRCVVLEDAVAGVDAAKRAGMACLAVMTTHGVAQLARADRVVESLADVTVADLAALAGMSGAGGAEGKGGQ